MNTKFDIEEVILKYLFNESDDNEIVMLNQWIKEDPAHKKQFFEFKDAWNATNATLIEHKIDTKKAFEVFSNRINENKIPELSKSNTIIFPYKKLLVAASILLLFGLTFLFLTHKNNKPVILCNENKEILIDTLTDNSVIVLSQNTEITKHPHYNKKNRSVNLKGKSFFEVVKNKELPFIVYTPSLKIEVTGTSFQINTNYESTNEELIVTSGQVKLSIRCQKDSCLLVNKGERILFNKLDKSFFRLPNSNSNYNSWRTGNLCFDNTSMNNVFMSLEDYYDINIDYSDDIFDNLRFTARFGKQSLDVVLESIEMALNIQLDSISKRQYVAKLKN